MPKPSKRQLRLEKKAEEERLANLEREKLAGKIDEVKQFKSATKSKISLKDRTWWILLVFLIPLIVNFIYFARKERIFESDKEKIDQDNTIQNSLISPRIDTTSYPKSDSVHGSYEFNPTFFSDTPSRQRYGPEIKGILIEKYRNPNFVEHGSISIQVGQLSRQGAAGNLLRYQNMVPLSNNPCDLSKPLMVGVKGDRLYVSVEFDNLNDGKNIGSMEFNHWKLWKDKELSYDYDYKSQNKFEVRDRNGYIVLAVEYVYNPDPLTANVYISGYLFDEQQVLVMNSGQATLNNYFPGGFDTCYLKKNDPDFKQNARRSIGEINSIFEHSNLKSTNTRFKIPTK